MLHATTTCFPISMKKKRSFISLPCLPSDWFPPLCGKSHLDSFAVLGLLDEHCGSPFGLLTYSAIRVKACRSFPDPRQCEVQCDPYSNCFQGFTIFTQSLFVDLVLMSSYLDRCISSFGAIFRGISIVRCPRPAVLFSPVIHLARFRHVATFITSSSFTFRILISDVTRCACRIIPFSCSACSGVDSVQFRPHSQKKKTLPSRDRLPHEPQATNQSPHGCEST